MKILYDFGESVCCETLLNELFREVCVVQFLLSSFRASDADPFLYLEHIEMTLESVSDRLNSFCEGLVYYSLPDELFQTLIE